MNLTEEIKQEMILRKEQTPHDIAHFLKVTSFAELLAVSENLEKEEIEKIEIAALLHDIGCPLCREKYGNTNGPLQEKEGAILAEQFLASKPLSDSVKERIVYLVGHHHTLNAIEGMDYQVLIEADYLVNAQESSYPSEAVLAFEQHYFKTSLGKAILEKMYA